MANEIPTNDGMNIETLKIDIDVSAKKGSSDIENFEKAVSRLEKSLETLNKALSSSEKSIGQLGKQSQKSQDDIDSIFSEAYNQKYTKSLQDSIKKMREAEREAKRYNAEMEKQVDTLLGKQSKKSPNISIYNSNTSSVGGNNAESIMSKIDRKKLAEKNKRDAEIEKKFNQPISEKSSTLGRWGKDDFAEAAKNAKMVSDSTDSARRHIEKYSEELGDIVNTYTVIDGQVTKIDSKIKKSEKSSKRMDTLWKSIGHVLKYRLISSAFNLISKGLTEGVEKAALFDDRINDSISNIIGSSKQLINQIGAAGGELIVSFEPVIVRLIEWLTIGADKVTQFFAALNGKDTYDKAVTQAYDFAKSIRGAYGGIGIDELNIFGSGADGGLLSDVQYVEESLDGWAQGISEFRKEMQPTVDWVNKNLDAVLATAISIGTTIAAIKFANSFKDALNKDLATSLVTGSKDLLGNLQTIAAIGTITLGISFLADENKENDLLGSFLLALGTGLGLTKAATALFSVSTGTALSVAIPVAVTFFLLSSFVEKGFGEMAVDTMTLNDQKLKAGMNYYNDSALPSSKYHTTDVLSKYYPNQVHDSNDVPYYSFADVINSSRNAEEKNSDKQDEMIYYLSQIASKNTNVILSDDDIGKAYERYIGVKGVTMNGGAYANAD